MTLYSIGNGARDSQQVRLQVNRIARRATHFIAANDAQDMPALFYMPDKLGQLIISLRVLRFFL